jgi:hypothetical protein
MKKVLFCQDLCCPPVFLSGQGVAISDRDFTPNAVAILDVQTRNKDVLVPRMTYTEHIYIQTNAYSMVRLDVAVSLAVVDGGTGAEQRHGRGKDYREIRWDGGADYTNSMAEA